VSKEARLLSKRLKNRWAISADERSNIGDVDRMKRFYRLNRFFRAAFAPKTGFVSLVAYVWAATFFLLATSSNAWAATFRTSNFIVHADSAVFARKVGEAAEQYRKDLAVLWLGKVLPNWSNPCVVTVKTGETLGPGGETVFTYCNNEVFDWKMTAQGPEARVLDSVLPHEITHTILASYLKAPAPRWIDEGMATSVEADVERTNYRTMLADYLHSRKGIAFNDMVAMKEYPVDLMPFYSQSFSVCEYLILIGGRRRLVEFAKEGARTNDWNGALRRYYEGRSLGDLQLEWVAGLALGTLRTDRLNCRKRLSCAILTSCVKRKCWRVERFPRKRRRERRTSNRLRLLLPTGRRRLAKRLTAFEVGDAKIKMRKIRKI